jgi:hypothetical protein
LKEKASSSEFCGCGVHIHDEVVVLLLLRSVMNTTAEFREYMTIQCLNNCEVNLIKLSNSLSEVACM